MSGAPSALVLDSSSLERLASWAANAAPREACGLLLGTRGEPHWRARSVRELENRARHGGSFRLDPAELCEALRQADREGLEVLAAWHSHAAGSLEPSPRDAAGTPEGWCVLVVGPRPELGARAAWRGPQGLLPLEFLVERPPGGSEACR